MPTHLVEHLQKRHLISVGISGIGSLSWRQADSEVDEPSWRTRMNCLLDQLIQHGCGLVITADEVRRGVPELKELAIVYQHFVREGARSPCSWRVCPIT